MGTSVRPSSLQAIIRPWPAMTFPAASISAGTTKPKVSMLRDLADLPGAMRTRVLGVELELGNRTIGYLNSQAGLIGLSCEMSGGFSHKRSQSSRVVDVPTMLSI